MHVSKPRYSDNDPHEWRGKEPWQYEVHGTDVSKYQGPVDWAEAKKSGSKSVVKRDVERLVTPGTLTEYTLIDARRNIYLLAI